MQEYLQKNSWRVLIIATGVFLAVQNCQIRSDLSEINEPIGSETIKKLDTMLGKLDANFAKINADLAEMKEDARRWNSREDADIRNSPKERNHE